MVDADYVQGLRKMKVGRSKGHDDMDIRMKGAALRAHMARLFPSEGFGEKFGSGNGSIERRHGKAAGMGSGYHGIEEVLSGEMEKRQVDAAFNLVRQRLGQVYKNQNPGVPL